MPSEKGQKNQEWTLLSWLLPMPAFHRFSQVPNSVPTPPLWPFLLGLMTCQAEDSLMGKHFSPEN